MDSRLIFLRHLIDVDQRGDKIQMVSERVKTLVALPEGGCR